MIAARNPRLLDRIHLALRRAGSQDMVKSGLKSVFIAFLSLIVISASPAFAEQATQAPEWVFGVLPKGNIHYNQSNWKQLVEQVNSITGQHIRFESAANLDEFEQKLANGVFDFVVLNAQMYTQAHDTMGYQAFAKEAGQKDKGIIVVQRDSEIKTVADLNSRTLALSDPRRYTSTVLTRAHLNQQGIVVNEEIVESDKSVYHAVLQGQALAGAGEIHTLNGINPAAHARLRVIWSSKPYSSSAFAAHPRVPPQQVATIRAALLTLNDDVNGKRLLNNIKLKGIANASDREWNDIRTLKHHLAH